MLSSSISTKWFQTSITVLLYITVCFTWGTTWVGIEKAVETVPPLTAAGARFVIAFPLFLLFAKIKKAPLSYPCDKKAFFIFITLFYFSVPYFLISFGEQYVSSGLTALIFSSMPVFMLIFSALILKETILLVQIAGIAIGFISLAMILIEAGKTFTFEDTIAAIAIVTAAVLHGLCYVLTKKNLGNISVITFNTLPIGISGILMLLIGITIEDVKYSEITNGSIFALAYLGLVASVGGFIIYFFLLKKLNSIVVSFVFIIFPVFAIAIDAFYNGKPITQEYILFSILMLSGFALTKFDADYERIKEVFNIRKKTYRGEGNVNHT